MPQTRTFLHIPDEEFLLLDSFCSALTSRDPLTHLCVCDRVHRLDYEFTSQKILLSINRLARTAIVELLTNQIAPISCVGAHRQWYLDILGVHIGQTLSIVKEIDIVCTIGVHFGNLTGVEFTMYPLAIHCLSNLTNNW